MVDFQTPLGTVLRDIHRQMGNPYQGTVSTLAVEYLIYGLYRLAPMETVNWLKQIPDQLEDTAEISEALTEARDELTAIIEMQIAALNQG